ncbi:MAG: DNA-3-methyladenine glycosylase I [Actinomycetaceae bacterium]|nr:DNA-3-methyladenine glycosylase I [Actinomycetaceae bacterium]
MSDIKTEQHEIRDGDCRVWYEGDPILEAYHDREWCKENHDDRFQFEMLCLEGASVGLSWKTIMHKREAYREVFHNFEIHACASMSDEELENLLDNPGLIRNKSKIFSVRKNAHAVQAIQEEFGSFDAYIWSFTQGKRIDGKWRAPEEVPTVSDVSIQMSKDMKKRGIAFVGPVITYSFLQAVGVLNDHLATCRYR